MAPKPRQIHSGDLEVTGKVIARGGIDSDDLTAAKAQIQAAVAQAAVASAAAQTASAVLSEAATLSGVLLALSSSTITRSRLGVYSPASIGASARYSDGTPYKARWIIATSNDGSAYTTVYTSAVDEASVSYALASCLFVRIRLYKTNDTTVLLREQIVAVTADASTTPIYLGALSVAPTDPAIQVNDYYFDANVPGSGGGVLRYYTGSSWMEATGSWPFYQDACWNALADMGAWATAQGSVIAAASAIFQKLVTADAFIANLFAQQITVPTGGRIQYETGSGVQKRAVRLHDEKIDWVDIPDTSPASPELLRARIGRLGVGDIVLLDGDFRVTAETTPWGGEVVVNAANSAFPDCIQLADGTIRACYQRVSDLFLVERIWNGSSWGPESVINPAYTLWPSYVQLINGQLRVSYVRNSDRYLIERIWNGSSWGAESVINASNSLFPDYIQSNDGTLRIAYRRYSDAYLVERIWNGSSWGAESVINNADSQTPSYIQLKDGTLKISYRRSTSPYIVERTWNGSSWGSEATISSTDGFHQKCIQMINDNIRICYWRASDGFLVERLWNGSSWGPETTTSNERTGDPTYVQLSDGSIMMMYTKYSNGYFAYRTLQQYAKIGSVSAGISALWPDYTRSTTITSGYTAPKNGWAFVEMEFYSATPQVKVNGILVTQAPGYGSERMSGQMCIPLATGNVITWNTGPDGSAARFFPCKGEP